MSQKDINVPQTLMSCVYYGIFEKKGDKYGITKKFWEQLRRFSKDPEYGDDPDKVIIMAVVQMIHGKPITEQRLLDMTSAVSAIMKGTANRGLE